MPTAREFVKDLRGRGVDGRRIDASLKRVLGVGLMEMKANNLFDTDMGVLGKLSKEARQAQQLALGALDPRAPAPTSTSTPTPNAVTKVSAPAKVRDAGKSILAGGGTGPKIDGERFELSVNPIAGVFGTVAGLTDTTKKGFNASFEASQKELAKRKKEPFVTQVGLDTAENIVGAAELLMQIAGIQLLDKTKGETAFDKARAGGKAMAEGVMANVATVTKMALEGDVEGILARPISLATTLVPMARGGKRLIASTAPKTAAKVAGKVAGASEAVAGASEAVAEGISKKGAALTAATPLPLTPAMRMATEVVDTALGSLMTKEGRAALTRTLVDGVAQGDPRATRFVEMVIVDPQKAAEAIKSDFNRLSRQVAPDADNPPVVPVGADEVIDSIRQTSATPNPEVPAAEARVAQREASVVVRKAEVARKTEARAATRDQAVVQKKTALAEATAKAEASPLVIETRKGHTVTLKPEQIRPAITAMEKQAARASKEIPSLQKLVDDNKGSRNQVHRKQRTDLGVAKRKLLQAEDGLRRISRAQDDTFKAVRADRKALQKAEDAQARGDVRTPREGDVRTPREGVTDTGEPKGTVTLRDLDEGHTKPRTDAQRAADADLKILSDEAARTTNREVADRTRETLADDGIDLPLTHKTSLTGTAVVADLDLNVARPVVTGQGTTKAADMADLAVWRNRVKQSAGGILVDIAEKVKKLDPELVSTLKAQGRSITDETLTAIANAARRNTFELMRVDGVRKAVVQGVIDRLPTRDRSARKQLAKQLNDSIKKALGPTINPEGPMRISGFDPDINDAFRASMDAVVNKASSTQLVQAAIAQVGDDLGRQLEAGSIKNSLQAEIDRIKPDGTPQKQKAITNELIADARANQPAPYVLPASIDPANLAKILITEAPGDAKVAALAKTLGSYVELDKALTGVDGWTKPSIKASIETHIRARNAFYDDGIMSNLVRLQKSAYVPRNVRSIINNYLSNEALQLFATANPVAPLVRLKRAIEYERYLSGGKVNPKNLEMFRAIERTGSLDTNRLSQDIGIISGFDPGSKIPIVKTINRAAERAFQMGDQIFKLDEAITNYKKANKLLGMMGDGNYMQAPAGSRTLRFTKKDGKIYVHDLNSPRPTKPKLLSPTELNDAVAAISIESAANKFLDYSRTPGGLQRLRASPFRGLGSGFATWAAKAIDAPGKPGLLAASIGEALKIQTNDPRILRRLSRDDFQLAVQRGVLLSAIRGGDASDKTSVETGSLFQYGTGGTRVALTRMLDPETAGNLDLSGLDYLAPTKTLMRNATSMALWAANLAKGGTGQAALDAIKHDGADPKKWKAYTRLLVADATGKLGSASDALDIIALGGSTILDTWERVRDTEEAGKILTVDDVISATLIPFVGSTVAQTLTGIREAIPGVTPSKSRQRTISDEPATRKSYLRWAVKHFIGKGWNIKSLDDSGPGKAYSPFWKYKREFLAGAGVRAGTKAGEALVLLGTQTGDKEMVKRGEAMVTKFDDFKDEISDVIDEMHDAYEKAAENKGKRVKSMPTPKQVDAMNQGI